MPEKNENNFCRLYNGNDLIRIAYFQNYDVKVFVGNQNFVLSQAEAEAILLEILEYQSKHFQALTVRDVMANTTYHGHMLGVANIIMGYLDVALYRNGNMVVDIHFKLDLENKLLEIWTILQDVTKIAEVNPTDNENES